MQPLEMLMKGAIAGLAISAPVGPVNVFCISRAVTKGRKAGWIAGVGAGATEIRHRCTAEYQPARKPALIGFDCSEVGGG